jgi:hypothetical protein
MTVTLVSNHDLLLFGTLEISMIRASFQTAAKPWDLSASSRSRSAVIGGSEADAA